MDIEKQIIKLKNQIKLNELSNDLYYVSGRYKEDYRHLHILNSALLKQKSKKRS